MLKHVTLLGSAALALTMAAPVTAQEQEQEQEQEEITGDTVVATVGDTEITIGQLIVARAQLPQQYSQFPNEALFDGLIEQLVQQQLLADSLEDAPAGIAYTLQNEQRSLRANEVVNILSAEAVTDEAIQEAYDAAFADVEEINEFNASHLLVATEEEALAAKARVDEGAAFADVARDVSTGPTGPNGGNLGWFAPGAMVPEFEEVIANLEVGDVSDPFETQFGWHVATLNETRVQPQPTLEQMRNQLANEIQEAAITARLEELAAAQDVVKPAAGDFDPDIIDRIDLLE